jgi:hypothetical protein
VHAPERSRVFSGETDSHFAEKRPSEIDARQAPIEDALGGEGAQNPQEGILGTLDTFDIL